MLFWSQVSAIGRKRTFEISLAPGSREGPFEQLTFNRNVVRAHASNSNFVQNGSFPIGPMGLKCHHLYLVKFLNLENTDFYIVL